MYLFRCHSCGTENPQSQYLMSVRCFKCKSICRLESYDPELSIKQKLVGTCSSLLKAIDDVELAKMRLNHEEAHLLKMTQTKISKFLKAL